MEAREWTNEFMKLMLKYGHGKTKDENGMSVYHKRGVMGARVSSAIPLFSHAMLESYTENTSEPLGRSCLTSFELLMRHVALWEAEIDGRIRYDPAVTLGVSSLCCLNLVLRRICLQSTHTGMNVFRRNTMTHRCKMPCQLTYPEI